MAHVAGLADEGERGLVTPLLEVHIEAVPGNIELAVHEPAVVRGPGFVERDAERLVPAQFVLRLAGPETLVVGRRFAAHGSDIGRFQAGPGGKVGGRGKTSFFDENGFDVLVAHKTRSVNRNAFRTVSMEERESGRRLMPMKIWLALLALAPATAMASEDDCKLRADRAAGIDATGVEKVVIRAGAGDLKVVGRANANRIEARGVACAGKQEMLDAAQVSVRREGNVVIVETALPQIRRRLVLEEQRLRLYRPRRRAALEPAAGRHGFQRRCGIRGPDDPRRCRTAPAT